MFLLKRLSMLSSHAITFIFTFHNVSIKTSGRFPHIPGCSQFTFHNVSIKTCLGFVPLPAVRDNLHSTMFLLKPKPLLSEYIADYDLHSTMFLLKHIDASVADLLLSHLHSTMFLLKRWCLARYTE